MPEILAILMSVVWMICIAFSFTFGGLIHLLVIFPFLLIIYRVAMREECY
ncbi:MAG: hypothetical protein HGA59_10865 [Chlorobiaceae bacterium]|nr:hypothetical protein [Chlorobiaceae bacterium]